jgi:RHS repeat-associated protein
VDGVAAETLNYSYDLLDRLTGVSGAYGESYSYDVATGNLASKAWQALTYNPSRPHAATGYNGSTYTYDSNGNMVTRNVGTSYTLTYDAENRLVSITSSGMNAVYTYNGDGKRVKAVVTTGGVAQTTAYVGDYFEISIGSPKPASPPNCPNSTHKVFLPLVSAPLPGVPAGHVWTSYYYAGTIRLTQRVQSNQDGVEDGLYYYLNDHLESTAVTLDAVGNKVAELRYKAWGETRFTSGTTPTQRKYTGQLEAEAGLYFYNARWYDPYLNRWLSPDSIIPDPYNPLDFDRYSYARNNPIKYNDPTGHWIETLLDFAFINTFAKKM